MGYGYDRMPRIFLGDTAKLTAYLMDTDGETLIPQAVIDRVEFTVVKPGEDGDNPSISAEEGDIVADGTGVFVVPPEVNDLPGNYRAIARFTYDEDGFTKVRSVPVEYDCVDTFERVGVTPADAAVDAAWKRLEDCFDSEQGGPWLRDMTMARFDRDKLKEFIPDVFLEVNSAMPQTNWTLDNFAWEANDGSALFSLGLLCAAIRHLMRSYTEQPDTMNSQVGYFDRRRYQQAWNAIYQIEQPRFADLLKLYKAHQWNTGASVLVSNKAGRYMSGAMRTRYTGRGGY